MQPHQQGSRGHCLQAWVGAAPPAERGPARPDGSLLAALTRVTTHPINYWAAYAVDAAGVGLFVALGLRAGGAHPVAALVVASLGYVGWTLFEYNVHRFLFHGPWRPLSASHLAHHAVPRATIGLPVFTAPAIAVGLFAACSSKMPMPYPYLFVAGAYFGYLWYAILHHLEHVLELSLLPYRRLRRHHIDHHGTVSANFGVSTTCWDRLFRTHLPWRERVGRHG
jgi:4-hydroxysphinganine ceramide fatty acyl 2-hydroxylase